MQELLLSLFNREGNFISNIGIRPDPSITVDDVAASLKIFPPVGYDETTNTVSLRPWPGSPISDDVFYDLVIRTLSSDNLLPDSLRPIQVGYGDISGTLIESGDKTSLILAVVNGRNIKIDIQEHVGEDGEYDLTSFRRSVEISSRMMFNMIAELEQQFEQRSGTPAQPEPPKPAPEQASVGPTEVDHKQQALSHIAETASSTKHERVNINDSKFSPDIKLSLPVDTGAANNVVVVSATESSRDRMFEEGFIPVLLNKFPGAIIAKSKLVLPPGTKGYLKTIRETFDEMGIPVTSIVPVTEAVFYSTVTEHQSLLEE